MTAKTYAELAVATDLQAGDLLASWRGIGPLKSVTASVAKTYFTGGTFPADGSQPMTGTMKGYVGSESLPGYTFDGDTDTGFYRASANTVGISTGGVNRVTVNSSGVTVVGVTTSTSFSGPLTGNVTGNVTGDVTGNASTATKWATARDLSLTGDGTATLASVDGSAAVSGALTLATVNNNVGSFGSATAVPVITVNGKGLITAVTTAAPTVNNSTFDATGGQQLTVAKGGTGTTTNTNHGVLLGQGTSAIAATSAGTSGQPLLSGGASADPSWGTLSVGFGGTGQTTLTDAAVLVGNGTSGIAAVSGSTAGDVLKWVGGGSDPAFGPVTSVYTQLGTSTVSSPVSAVTFTSISASYGSLLLAINGASHNSGSAQNLQFYVSVDNGSTWSFNPLVISASESASASFQGGVSIAGYRTARPVITGTAEVSNPAPDIVIIGTLTAGVTAVGVANLTPPINAIKIQFTGGSVDAGTFTLYGC